MNLMLNMALDHRSLLNHGSIKAQEKMKQQTLEALLSIFDEKIQYNRDTSTSLEKGRIYSNLKT